MMAVFMPTLRAPIAAAPVIPDHCIFHEPYRAGTQVSHKTVDTKLKSLSVSSQFRSFVRPPRMLAGFLAAGILICACKPATTQMRSPKEYTDDLGRSVEIVVPVSRMVSLAPNLTEIAFAAGAGTRLVGVTTADNYPQDVDTIPRFNAVPIDFEMIRTLEPDVVLATDQVNSPKDATMFESLGIPVYFLSFSSLDDIFDAVVTVGSLTGTKRRASDHSTTLRQAVIDLRDRVRAVEQRPRVMFLIGEDKLFGFGKGSYVHEIIDAAGGVSVTADEPLSAPVFSDEYVLETKPDVIVGSFSPEVDAKRLLELHPAWRTVPAIQSGRVYAINPDIVLRPGPRVVEGAYRMALMLHPDLFGDSPVTSSR